jgi:flagellar hook-associated protein 2
LGLRFDPMGGGQFKQAVKSIIEAEGQPIRQLEAHKAKEQERLKLFQEFKGKFAGMDKAIAELSNFQSFRELKVDLGDGQAYAAVTIDKTKAQPGTYKIQIDDLAARSSVITNGFPDPDEKVLGLGYVVFNQANGDSKEILIEDDKSSLRGMANAINSSGAPVTASVIKDMSDPDNPWRMIMAAKKDGGANSVEIPELYFMDGDRDISFDDKKEAHNAQIKVNDFAIEAESNDVKDFLPGINLHLKQAKADTPFTMTVTEDSQKVTGKVKGLVDGMNEILGFITKQNTVDAGTDTSTTFAGDTSLQNIEYRLRNLMQEGFPSGSEDKGNFRFIHLNELGIEFDKTGKLTFKDDKFQKALEGDFDAIAEGISGEHGLAYQLRQTISSYTQSGTGVLSIRETGIRARISDMDRQIDDKTKRLDARQQQLTDQFARLEGSLADMQRQSAALGSLGGGGGNMVSQLLGG